MGLFDEFISPFIEPLKEVNELVQQVKDDAISAASQIGDDVANLKEEGQTAITELKETVQGDSNAS